MRFLWNTWFCLGLHLGLSCRSGNKILFWKMQIPKTLFSSAFVNIWTAFHIERWLVAFPGASLGGQRGQVTKWRSWTCGCYTQGCACRTRGTLARVTLPLRDDETWKNCSVHEVPHHPPSPMTGRCHSACQVRYLSPSAGLGWITDLSFWLQLPANIDLGRKQWWLNSLGSCFPNRRTGLSSWLVASVSSQPNPSTDPGLVSQWVDALCQSPCTLQKNMQRPQVLCLLFALECY